MSSLNCTELIFLFMLALFWEAPNIKPQEMWLVGE